MISKYMLSLSQWITVSILIGVLLVIRALFGRYIQQRFKYALWLVVAVKLLIPVAFVYSLFTWNIADILPDSLYPAGQEAAVTEKADTIQWDEEENQTGKVGRTAKNTLQNGKTTRKEAEQQTGMELAGENKIQQKKMGTVSAAKKTFYDYIPVIWMAGVVLLGLGIIGNNVLFYMKLKRKRILQEVYRDKLNVYTVDEVQSPCLFGLFSPAVYLTQELYEDTDKREYILLHEWMHYHHKDMFWAFIRSICLVLYWYHPFVWAAYYLSIRDSEFACDEGVILALSKESRREYGKMLLDICAQSARKEKGTSFGFMTGHSMATKMTGRKSEMRQRIQFLVKRPKAAMPVLLILSAAVLLCAGCSFDISSISADSISVDSISVDSISADSISVEGQADGREAGQRNPFSSVKEPAVSLSYEEQLQLIDKNKEQWCYGQMGKALHEGAVDETDYSYVITDLDQNGRLEVISELKNSVMHQLYELNEDAVSIQIFEVKEDGNGLTECPVDAKIAPDLSAWESYGQEKVYYEGTSGTYHYPVYRHLSDGAGHEEEHLFDMVMKDGKVVVTEIGSSVTEGKDESVFYDGNGEKSSTGNYNELKKQYYSQWTDLTEDTIAAGWFQSVYESWHADEEGGVGNDFYSHAWTAEEFLQNIRYSWQTFTIGRKTSWTNDANMIYTEFAKKLQEKEGKKFYMAMVPCDEPVLLIEENVMRKGVYTDENGQKIHAAVGAEVYQYDEEKEEVVYIGRVTSTGSGYPVMQKGNYILTGFHHSSDRLLVSGGVGKIDRVDGFATEEKVGHLYQLELKDGKETEKMKVEIPAAFAEELDYYAADGKIIAFEKVK